MAVSTVVIGYDPTDRARRAYATGVELAVALGADLHLVTAWPSRLAPTRSSAISSSVGGS